MPNDLQNISPAQDYVAKAMPHEQLCVIAFKKNEPTKFAIQPSADNLYLPYLQRYVTRIVEYSGLPDGEVVASLHDAIWSKIDDFPKLCFGRAVGDTSCFLLPDPFYIKGDGYLEDFDVIKNFDVPWNEKKTVAYFRGASTGGQLTLEHWRTNRRVQLAVISRDNPEAVDAKITVIVQEDEEGVGEEIKKAGLFSHFEPPETCLQYRYLIDIDGNANSWGYYLKLAMGSVVFKVESIWEEWFYQWIKPWVHYVPVKADLSDLIEKINWARLNDKEAQRIAEQGKEFARAFTYPRALEYGAEQISNAIRMTNLLTGQNLS